MKATAKKVLDAARNLPEDDRIAVLETLLADLDGADEGVDATWAAEIERRTREIDEKLVKPVSWATVKRRVARQTGGTQGTRIPSRSR